MSDFLNDFIRGEKSPEEKTLLAAQEVGKKRDVLRPDLSGIEDGAEEADDEVLGCDIPAGGCGGCGCRG